MTLWRSTIARLFSSHRDHLEALVRRRVRDREAASEIVQDVFTRVLASGTNGSDEDDRRVLYASARNAAIDHNLAISRRRSALEEMLPEQLSPGQPSEDAALEARNAVAALDRALNQLPARTREIFVRRRVYGESNVEISRRFGISISAVEKHLLRAMRHCRSAVADHLDIAGKDFY
jgi:RNA polymerase sigma-70 factor (ECF subfamily)